jgi:hypothetical protein
VFFLLIDILTYITDEKLNSEKDLNDGDEGEFTAREVRTVCKEICLSPVPSPAGDDESSWMFPLERVVWETTRGDTSL